MSATAAPAWTIERGNDSYPAGLEALEASATGTSSRGEGAPDRLYGLGARAAIAGLDPDRAVTIVGARRASPYGRRVAAELAGSLAAAGLTVVSGMAYGIDSAAHRGALDAGGLTVAVLAGGPDVPYPRSAARLHRRIVASGGAVVSEAPAGTVPATWQFPARNRIMAALARVTVVVEATARSGTRHTVDAAERVGHLVGAVPGPVHSRLQELPHELIRCGAIMVRGAQDVLDELFGVGMLGASRVGPPLDAALSRLLELVARGHDAPESLTARAKLPPAEVGVGLARLELLDYVRVDGGGYVPTGLEPPRA
jgi:DNA processing protein